MGFRTGAYAKIWEVTPMSYTSTKVRLSVSRKNKQTNEYEQDFSGFVLAIGTAAAKKAACLKEGERIMIKRTIKETVREYDADGKVVRETVTETTEDDDTMYFPQFQTYQETVKPWWEIGRAHV